MKCRHWALSALLILTTAAATHAQTVMTPASTRYDRSALWRFWFGENWRATWQAPIQAPVLDLGTYAGGIEPYKKGGNQSRTLRFRGADGRTYIFRSTDKFISRNLPDDLKDTPAGEVIADQSSAIYPNGALAVTVLQEAVGLLQAPPTLVYMPDDPRLGEFRAEYANLLGTIEERPDESEEEGKTFANAEKIIGMDKLFEKLEESMEDRLEISEWLKGRLIDFMIGDTDRGADQWRWAKFEDGERDVYRPIPRDRDYAFMKSQGALMRVVSMLYPKLVTYNEQFSPLIGLVFMTREFDRAHLIELPWSAWDSTTAFVQERITDDVIARAVAQLSEAHQRTSGGELAAGLRARRDNLREIARRYYEMVVEDADIFTSDESEHVEVMRNPDGSVTVRIWREGTAPVAPIAAQPAPAGNGSPGAAPVFDRTFTPDETQEIRIHLERGDDYAIVRGDVERSIEVRIVGGEGDDVLIDSSRVAHGDKTSFYDAHGNNTIVRGRNTRVLLKPYVVAPPKRTVEDGDEEEPEENPRILSEERRGRTHELMMEQQDFIEKKTKSEDTRTWGQKRSYSTLFDYRDGAGIIVGVGPAIIDYGFRRRPYEWQASLRGLAGTGGGFGVQLDAERYFERGPWSTSLFAHATQLESNRSYGFGNDTERLDARLTLVKRDEILVQPLLNYLFSRTARLSIGPIARYTQYEQSFGQLGARAELQLDNARIETRKQSGLRLNAGGATYPAAWDVTESFSTAHALAHFYIPLGTPTLALRAGGQRAWGSFPLHDAAFVGGGPTVRGYRWNRFGGDAAAFGSAELRLPVGRITLLTRGELGLIGFTDAGRVWFDGDSSGGWHTSAGGGLWFGSLGQSVSITYAQGEEGIVNLFLGLPF